MEINICHLYPDILNLYGDRGNLLCLTRRLQWRGIRCNVTEVATGDQARFSGFDLVFMGGGQDFEREPLLADLKKGKGAEIRAAIEDEKVFLAICGGFQMLGKHYRARDGREYDFIGAANYHTLGAADRLAGDFAFRCTPESGGSVAVGFENHSGRTYLGDGVSPLGTVLKGHGNNGEDHTEGVRYKNVFGSYAHGPLLPKNPLLADFILTLALKRKHPAFQMPQLDDSLELRANTFMKTRLGVE